MNILSGLPFVLFSEIKTLPHVSAVYFVVSTEGKILYVGQTINLKKRWESRNKWEMLIFSEKKCDKVYYKKTKPKDLLSEEENLISDLNPELNGSKKDKERTVRNLTARQQKMLDFIKSQIKKNGCPPTLREMAGHMGSKYENCGNAAICHLKALERKGYIVRGSNKARQTKII